MLLIQRLNYLEHKEVQLQPSSDRQTMLESTPSKQPSSIELSTGRNQQNHATDVSHSQQDKHEGHPNIGTLPNI